MSYLIISFKSKVLFDALNNIEGIIKNFTQPFEISSL